MTLSEHMQNILSVSNQDWINLFSIFVGMVIVIGLGEMLRKKLRLSPEVTRKFVHISIGVLVVFATKIFVSIVPPLILGLVFITVNLVAIRMGLLTGMHDTSRKSYGTVYYPVAFVLLVVLFWFDHPAIISISMLVLAFGDAGAAILGENLHSPTIYRLTTDKKSIEGSTIMLVVSFLCLFLGIRFLWGTDVAVRESLVIAAVGAVVATAWEAISSQGFDNLSVPISVAFILFYYLVPTPLAHPDQFSIGIGLSLLIAVLSWYFAFLTASGSVATFLLASIIYGIGGWKWTLPILTFFVLSSLLSKVGRKRKMQFDSVFEKSSRRDYAQVGANGGIAGIIIVLQFLFPSLNLYAIYLGSVAAVTADTWGTEIGLLKNFPTYSMTKLRQVSQGSNGGVSVAGLAGGFLGSLVTTSSAYFWIQGISTLLLISTAGFLACLVDSILGDTLQVSFQCQVCSKITEKKTHCTAQTRYVSGVHWMDNDRVNWICAISGAAFAVLAFLA